MSSRAPNKIIKVPSLCEINHTHTKPKWIWFLSLLLTRFLLYFSQIFSNASIMCNSVAKEVQTLSISINVTNKCLSFCRKRRKMTKNIHIFKWICFYMVCLLNWKDRKQSRIYFRIGRTFWRVFLKIVDREL